MRSNDQAYLESLSRLPLPPVFLYLCPPRLFLELPLTYSTVVLESEQDIQGREPLYLRIRLPRFRLEYHRVRGPPFRQHVDLQFFEQVYEFPYASRA